MFLLTLVFLIASCAASPSPSAELLSSVADVSIVTHNHWTQDDVNDGQIVFIDLVDKRNTSIDPRDLNIGKLTISLVIKGYDDFRNEYLLLERTYEDLGYADVSYPQGDGIVILFSELKGVERASSGAIWAQVTLPNGKTVKNHDAYDFPTKPIKFMQ